jgi:hypothetical protein
MLVKGGKINVPGAAKAIQLKPLTSKYVKLSIRHPRLELQGPLVLDFRGSIFVGHTAASAMPKDHKIKLPDEEGSRSCRLLEAGEGHQAIKGIRTLILDCDGILWRGNDVLPQVPQAINELRRQRKRLCFLTNNSSKSRRQCAP